MKNIKVIYILLGVISFLFSFTLCTTVALGADNEALEGGYISPWTSNPGLVEYGADVFDLEDSAQRILYACALLRDGVFVPDPPEEYTTAKQFKYDIDGNKTVEVSIDDFWAAKSKYYESIQGEAAPAPTVGESAQNEPVSTPSESASSLSTESNEIQQPVSTPSVTTSAVVKDDNAKQEKISWIVYLVFGIIVISALVGIFKKIKVIMNNRQR